MQLTRKWLVELGDSQTNHLDLQRSNREIMLRLGFTEGLTVLNSFYLTYSGYGEIFA